MTKTHPARLRAPGSSSWEPARPGPSLFVAPKDGSARAAVHGLATCPGAVTGDQMTSAILDGIVDRDATAALADFQRFARALPNKLSPEAREVLAIYELAVARAHGRGEHGIGDAALSVMATEMRNVRDVGARRALQRLDRLAGPITGERLVRTIIAGTRDRDPHAAGLEFAEFAAWAKANEVRLTASARQALAIYERYAITGWLLAERPLAARAYASLVAELKEVKTAP